MHRLTWQKYSQIWFGCLLGLWFSTTGESRDIVNIKGWVLPNFNYAKPEFWLGNDPVLGRLICPSLTVLDLKQQTSVLLILNEANILKESGQIVWELGLRSGIYWWNGQEVNIKDVAAYLKNNLEEMIKLQGGGHWKIPQYQIVESSNQLRVIWQEQPEFGPFVLNGYSFWRRRISPNNKLQFECAGNYIASKQNDYLSLEPQPKYGLGLKSAKFHLKSSVKNKEKALNYDIEFKNASDFDSNPNDRHPERPISCRYEVSTPVISALSWNPNSPMISNPELRKIMTNLIPRGNLARSAGGYLGSLPSSLILREHPGYNTDVKVRVYNIEFASNKLEQLGYKRKTSKDLRVSPEGLPMKFRIGVEKNAENLIKKVVEDSFYFIGAGVEFIESPKSPSEVDGLLTGLYTPWPDANFIGNFHSKSEESNGTYRLSSPDLDRALSGYASSLTEERPDFKKLQKIHQLLFDLEPVSVILQHSVCMELSPGIKLGHQKIDITDPDWFRNIMLSQ